MKKQKLVIATLLFAALGSAQAADTVDAAVAELLAAYARKDLDATLALIADEPLVMGTDVSEACTTKACVRALFEADYALWKSATFGAPQRLFTRKDGALETAFFDAPFSTTLADGSTRQFTIRFATVWRRGARGLELVQSLNAVPTVGQSAADIARNVKAAQ